MATTRGTRNKAARGCAECAPRRRNVRVGRGEPPWSAAWEDRAEADPLWHPSGGSVFEFEANVCRAQRCDADCSGRNPCAKVYGAGKSDGKCLKERQAVDFYELTLMKMRRGADDAYEWILIFLECQSCLYALECQFCLCALPPLWEGCATSGQGNGSSWPGGRRPNRAVGRMLLCASRGPDLIAGDVSRGTGGRRAATRPARTEREWKVY